MEEAGELCAVVGGGGGHVGDFGGAGETSLLGMPKKRVNMPVVWLMVAGVSDSVRACWRPWARCSVFCLRVS